MIIGKSKQFHCPSEIFWLLKTISYISLAAAMLSGVISLLFFLRFDPEPPTDRIIIRNMLESVYENSDQEILKESYRDWHYLSLGAYFTGRDQYIRGVTLCALFSFIYFFSRGLKSALEGKPRIRKKGKVLPFRILPEILGLILILLLLTALTFFSRNAAATDQLPVSGISPWESANGNWNSFRGPLAGRSPEAGPDPENLEQIWSLRTGRQGHSSPVIWDNQLFLIGADKEGLEFMKVELQTGELLWTADFPVDPENLPEVSFDTGWAPSTPVCDRNGVYGLFGDGSLIALDHHGGLMWTLSLGNPDNPYGHASSLAIYQDRLYIQYDQSDRAHLTALSAIDGRTLWSRERPAGASWASPVPVLDGEIPMIVTASNPDVSAYHAFSGEKLWATDCLSGEIAPSITWDSERIYAVQEGAGVFALDMHIGEVIWKDESGPQGDVPSPVVIGDNLIVPTSYGILSIYDAADGELVSYIERYDGAYASPILLGSYVYWPDMFGTLSVYSIDKELKLLKEIPLGEEVMATPAVSCGFLFIRGINSLSAWGIPDE